MEMGCCPPYAEGLPDAGLFFARAGRTCIRRNVGVRSARAATLGWRNSRNAFRILDISASICRKRPKRERLFHLIAHRNASRRSETAVSLVSRTTESRKANRLGRDFTLWNPFFLLGPAPLLRVRDTFARLCGHLAAATAPLRRA